MLEETASSYVGYIIMRPALTRSAGKCYVYMARREIERETDPAAEGEVAACSGDICKQTEKRQHGKGNKKTWWMGKQDGRGCESCLAGGGGAPKTYSPWRRDLALAVEWISGERGWAGLGWRAHCASLRTSASGSRCTGSLEEPSAR